MSDIWNDLPPVHYDNEERFGTSSEMIAQIRALRSELAAVRLAVREECAKAIRERRWSADPAAIAGGSEIRFANERELAAFVLGLEEAVKIVRAKT